MLPHYLTKFEIPFEKEPKFNGVYSRNNLSKIKDGAYVVNPDESKSTEAHWIALFVNGDNVIYFGSSGVKHIPKEIKKIIDNKSNKTNIYKIQASDLWILLYWIY